MLEQNEGKVLDVNLKLRHVLYPAATEGTQDTRPSSDTELHDLPISHMVKSMSQPVCDALDQAYSHAVASQLLATHPPLVLLW